MSKRTAGLIVGREETMAIISRVPQQLIDRIPEVVVAMLKPYEEQMKLALAPDRRSGWLIRSIRSKVIAYPSGVAFGIVGADRGVGGTYRGKRVVPANYAHLLNYGTQPHAIGKGSYLKRANRSRQQVQTGRIHPGAKPHPFREAALAAGRAASFAAGNAAAGKLIAEITQQTQSGAA